MPNIRGPELLILVLVIVLLFGAKRLPDAARSVGRSLRIFKSETKGLVDGEESAEGTTTTTAAQAPAQAPPPAPLPPAAPAQQIPPTQQTPPPAPMEQATQPAGPEVSNSSLAPNADEARSALQQPPSQA